MRLEAKKLLEGIRRAAELISSLVHGEQLADYGTDPMLRSAVERQFEIAGEAFNRPTETDPSASQRVTHTSRVIAFRNVLIRGYDLVDHEVVWDVTETHLPVLRRQVGALLAEGDE